MPLKPYQKRQLRALAHPLKPVVLLGGQGLSEAVLEEIEHALGHHELIKVRIPGMGREEKRLAIEAICARTGAELVQTIGHVAVLFRPRAKDSKLMLPR